MAADPLKHQDGNNSNESQNQRILDQALPLAGCQATRQVVVGSFHFIQLVYSIGG